jgi:hypothetical protein
MSESVTQAERIKDFLLYTVLEQERKLFQKTKESRAIIDNPIPLWYSYSSAFAATTLSMRVPLWFVCSVWTTWIPHLKIADVGTIKPSPDPQGASLALLASLDLPEHITPAQHIVAMCKWLRELIPKWNKERQQALASFSLDSDWSKVEEGLAKFYIGKLSSLIDSENRFLTVLWSYADSSLTAVMPQEMTPDEIKVHVLGSPVRAK